MMQRDSSTNGRGSHQWPPGHGGMNPDMTRSHTQPSLSTAQLERMRMEHEIEQARFQLLDQARSLERIRQSQHQMDMIHHTTTQQRRNEEMMMLAAELRRRQRLTQMSRTQDQPDVSTKNNEKQQPQLMMSSNPVMPNRQLPQSKRNTPFNPAA